MADRDSLSGRGGRPYRPFGDTRLWRIGLPLLGAAVFAAVFSAAVLTDRGQALENRALRAAEFGRSVPELLRLVSVPDLVIATLALVAVALVRRRPDAASRAVAVLVVSNVAAQLLKNGLLSRPSFTAELTSTNTFPSGHTAAWVSVSFAALIVCPPVIRSLVGIASAITTSIVTYDLLDHAWHRLSDIVGAITLVLVLSTLAITLIPGAHTSTRSAPFGRVATRLLGSIALVTIVLGALSIVGALLANRSADNLLLWATEAIAICAVCASTALILVFLERTTASETQMFTNARSVRASR